VRTIHCIMQNNSMVKWGAHCTLMHTTL